jgi:uncharacterized protein
MDNSKLINPFALGGVVTGKRFAGRSAEIERVRMIAQSGQHVYLFAPRRYGKTSLLREAFARLEQAGDLVVVWCDCLPSTDVQSLAIRLAEEVVRASHAGRAADWGKTIGSLFKRLRPALKIDSHGQATVSLEVGPNAPALPNLEDALSAVEQLAIKQGKPLVLVLDEFQQIAEWDKGHQTEAVMRTAIQNFHRVSCIFAGSERHLLQHMFSDRARPLFQLAAPFPLGRLSAAELSPWLTDRFRETGLDAPPEALDAIFAIAAGHPAATQFVGHYVWDAALISGSNRITAGVVQQGLAQALDASDTIYAGEYARLTAPQRQVLAALVAEPTKSITAAEYLRRHRLPAKSTVDVSAKTLLAKGYVEQEDGVYLISDPLFGHWIQRLYVVSASDFRSAPQ